LIVAGWLLPAGAALAFSSTSGACFAASFHSIHGSAQAGNGGFSVTSSSSTYSPGETIQITLAAGEQAIRWDGRGDDGADVLPGVYFVRLDTDGTAQTRKVL
jgi:hypothetical protein